MKKQLAKLVKKYGIRQKDWMKIGLPSFIIGIIFFLAAFSNVSTEVYQMSRFSIAQETIRSPLTIENKQQTEQATREAVLSVEDHYTVSGKIVSERVAYINELFDALEELDAQESYEKSTSIQSKAEELRSILSVQLAEAITTETLLPLVNASENERSVGKELLTTSVYETMNDGVQIEEVETARKTSRQSIRYSSLHPDMKNSLYAISDFVIVENTFIDPEETLEARKQAARNIEPVMIRAGEVVVQKGQTITSDVYEELKLLGLLNQGRNIYPLAGLALFSGLLSVVIGFFLFYNHRLSILKFREVATVLLISILMVLLMKAVSLFMIPVGSIYLLVPAATGAMLLKILLNERFAFMMAVVYSLMGGLLFNEEISGSLNMEAAVYIFFSQMAGIIALSNIKDRLAFLKAGICVILVQLMTMFVFVFFSFEKYGWFELTWHSGYAVLGAIISVVLMMGLLPFFETGLKILSETKLIALSNPNHPLLRKVLMEAPGTYHHSLMVANLSEAACEAVGANGLLARVAAYYHDVGKTVQPHFFIENQMGIQNPHDRLDPRESAGIILKHPCKGAELLREYKLPQEIIDIAEQHHGNTLLKYFYYKEKELNPLAKEADFRYPGPIPKSKEAAIVCICDSVEAAVRSMKAPDKKKISSMVTSIIQDRTNDGQFDDTPLTFNELHTVHTAICETLGGVFHSRIEYPETKKHDVKEAN